MTVKTKDIFNVVKYLGPNWIFFRLRYALAQRFGSHERRMPLANWQEINDYDENPAALALIPSHFSKNQIEQLLRWDNYGAAKESVITQAEAVLQGEFFLFSHHRKHLDYPPDWHKNAMTGEVFARGCHWSRIHDFGNGDIKCVWEMSRFPWAFALARAYGRTGDERYAEGFWELFENWLENNPPNEGVNWKCGQEATFRLIAAAFARKVLSFSKATTQARLAIWRKFVAFTGQRIAGNIDYALSQNNNHGISECIGLITVARLLPGLPEAGAYLVQASQNLLRQLDTLVYQDTGFSQHSTVYHRVVVHTLIWYLAIEKAVGNIPEKPIIDGAMRALHFLVGITDLQTGLAPLHGSNDGANILPLSSSNYLDYRSALVGLAALLNIEIPVPAGLHDETLLWFSQSLPEEEAAGTAARDFSAEQSGWNILVHTHSRLFCYAPTEFKHRPAQADLLHCDIWWHGLAITRDPGSFSYNSSGRFSSGFDSTAVHNTVTVDNTDQMHKFSRFLYLPWPACKVVRQPGDQELKTTHDAYRDRNVQHTRTIQRLPGDQWVIYDHLDNFKFTRQEHFFQLHWLLADFPYTFSEDSARIVLHTPAGDYCLQVLTKQRDFQCDLVRADQHSDRGWWSPYYYHAEPALSFRLTTGGFSLQIHSIFTPGSGENLT
jgi:hypothetical protein